MNLRVRWQPLLLAAALAALPAAAASPIVIKLSTAAPEGTVWHQGLERMADDWKRTTDGRVTARIYAGGIAGDEPDMIRKMRLGQIHAASISIIGLSNIDDAFDVFSIPMFYDSYDELYHVMGQLEPAMRQRLEERGFVLLGWGIGGWVHVFTKRPVTRFDDLRDIKMFVSAGNAAWVRYWKKSGFRPVPLATTDVLTGLQTGLIDGLPSTPLAALSLQWFRQAPNMLDLGLAPLVGATVVSRKTWERLGEARPEGADRGRAPARANPQDRGPAPGRRGGRRDEETRPDGRRARGGRQRLGHRDRKLSQKHAGRSVSGRSTIWPVRARNAYRESAARRGRTLKRILHRIEDSLAASRCSRWSCCRSLEIVMRSFTGVGIPASTPIVQHLTLWVAFLGAGLAARENKLLALGTSNFIPEGRWRDLTRVFTSTVAVAVCAAARKGGDRPGPRRARGRDDHRRGHPGLGHAAGPPARVRASSPCAWPGIASARWIGRAIAAGGVAGRPAARDPARAAGGRPGLAGARGPAGGDRSRHADLRRARRRGGAPAAARFRRGAPRCRPRPTA